MNAGRLDRKISILALDTTRDSFGGDQMTYTLVKNCFAHVKWGKGDERESDSNLTSNQMVSFKIRYTNLISPTHVIDFGSIKYNIKEIKEIGRRAYLQVETEKRI